ncbi:MAG: hypothetical protein M1820_000088 [Bogoriella megaspora]|nr:MAG: hypothetical protein M1820_000088 [Bogoriella megaspora]
MDKKPSEWKLSIRVVIFAFVVAALATSYLFFTSFWLHDSTWKYDNNEDLRSSEQYQNPPLPLDPFHPSNVESSTDRAHFGGFFTSVRCWPSKGGIVAHDTCSIFEVNFLGLDPLNTTPSNRDSDPEEEDRFCNRLRMIGGRSSKTESAYNSYSIVVGSRDTWDVWLGWPGEKGREGKEGVWVLKLNHVDGRFKGAGRIRNMSTMGDRCKAIEMLGGQFYKDYQDVEDLRNLDLSW